MASYVDFPMNSESKYISRMVDLPLYRMCEKPEMKEISCEPPRPNLLHETLTDRKLEHGHLKKSSSCISLSKLQKNNRCQEPAEEPEKKIYETFHGATPDVQPLRVQKPKKKKGFLRTLFIKKNTKLENITK